MSEIKTIIPFSGGIDSTAVLYSMLKENPNEQFLIVHVLLINGESFNRYKLEHESVKNILKRLKELGFNNFEYKEASMDYLSAGEIPPVWDIEALNLIMAIYVRDTSVNRFIKATNFDDFQQDDFLDRIENSETIFFAASQKKRHEFQFEYPQRNKTKQQVIASLPKELLVLTWSCRRPMKVDGELVVCGSCEACEMMASE